MFPAVWEPPRRLVHLTRQEARCLAAAAISTDRASAAELVGTSRHTLSNHLRAAFEVLHARSLQEALWLVGWTLPPLDLLDLPAREPDQLIWIGGIE